MSTTRTIQRASLDICEPSTSDSGTPGATIHTINFQINPTSYTIAKKATWQQTRTKGSKTAGPTEFQGAEPSSVNLDIVLDQRGADGTSSSEERNIQQDIDALFTCLVPTANSISSGHPSAPFVKFGWGRNVLLTAYVESVSVNFKLFDESGTPTRAVATVTLKQVPQSPARQNPTSGGLAPTRSRTVIEGETLPSIAWSEYHDAALWRTLAEANGIDDPLRLRSGVTLLVPSLTDSAYYG